MTFRFTFTRNSWNISKFRRQRWEMRINMCGCALFAFTDFTPLTSSLFMHCGRVGIVTFVATSSSKLVLGNIFPSRVADTSSGDSRTSFADGAFSLVESRLMMIDDQKISQRTKRQLFELIANKLESKGSVEHSSTTFGLPLWTFSRFRDEIRLWR